MTVAEMVTAVTDLLTDFPIVTVALSVGAIVAAFGLLIRKGKSIAR